MKKKKKHNTIQVTLDDILVIAKPLIDALPKEDPAAAAAAGDEKSDDEKK
jgi:hypothetical protein